MEKAQPIDWRDLPQDLQDRLTCDPQGNFYVAGIPESCDACPHCPDVCSLEHCADCSRKKVIYDKYYENNRLAKKGTAKYTLCQIRRHNCLKSPWIVAHGKVYDASEIVREHGGGTAAILKCAGGTDSSKHFDFHSNNAKNIWRQSVIGRVMPCNGRDDRENRRLQRSMSWDVLLGVPSTCEIS